MAVARDLDGAHTSGSSYDGAASHSFGWAVTAYQPRELLEGIYANHWGGALAWSYYDNGTGSWADYRPPPPPSTRRTPPTWPSARGPTRRSLRRPTRRPPRQPPPRRRPPRGNPATATAQAGLTGTPQPPCVGASPTPAACAIHLSDVQPSDYFYAPVQYLFCHNIVSGYADGTYRPANTTTARPILQNAGPRAGLGARQPGGADLPRCAGQQPLLPLCGDRLSARRHLGLRLRRRMPGVPPEQRHHARPDQQVDRAGDGLAASSRPPRPPSATCPRPTRSSGPSRRSTSTASSPGMPAARAASSSGPTPTPHAAS